MSASRVESYTESRALEGHSCTSADRYDNLSAAGDIEDFSCALQQVMTKFVAVSSCETRYISLAVKRGETRFMSVVPDGVNRSKLVILRSIFFCLKCENIFSVLWVPVTTAWRVIRFRMEERPPIRREAANTLNKQSRTADEGWSSSLGVGRGANNSSP
jgi:hypothetical protein